MLFSESKVKTTICFDTEFNPTPTESVELAKKSLNRIKGLFNQTVQSENWDALSQQGEVGRLITDKLALEIGHSAELDAEIKAIRNDFERNLLQAEKACIESYIDAADDEIFIESDASRKRKEYRRLFNSSNRNYYRHSISRSME